MPSSCPATWALRWWGKRRVRSRRRKCLLRLSAVDCPAPSETPAVRLTAHLFPPSLVRTALSTRCRLLPCSPNPCHRAYQPPFQYTTPTPRCKPSRRLAFSSVLSIVLTSPPPPTHFRSTASRPPVNVEHQPCSGESKTCRPHPVGSVAPHLAAPRWRKGCECGCWCGLDGGGGDGWVCFRARAGPGWT
ncbi:hypothetical protein BJ546DRAFT_50629 [Cryomyces antarcticus]